MIGLSLRGALYLSICTITCFSSAVPALAADAADIVRVFQYDTSDRCYIDTDIRFVDLKEVSVL